MTRFVFWEAPPSLVAQAAPIYADLAAIKMQLALIKLALKAGYNPAQPRVPAGNGRISGRWGGNSSWKDYPRKVTKRRRVTLAIPNDAITYRAPDGTVFHAPPGADFQQVYAAGQNIRNIPISEQFAYINANVGQDGILIFSVRRL